MKRYRIFYLILAGIGSIIPFYCFILCGNKAHHHVPTEVRAIECIDWDRIKPIDEGTLTLNPLRKKAGLMEVRRNWKIAPSTLRICDGPTISLILNEQNIPVKVMSTGFGRAWPPDPNNQIAREFDIVDFELNGRAATWLERPRKLYFVETYQSNKLNGPTHYFSETGEVICQCSFRKGKPWTGRSLQRDGFNSTSWDISYKDGQLDGAEKFFEEDKLAHLRTFKNGIPHGLQQQYHKGQLRSERIIENGITRHFTSWHQNGQLQEETKYNHKGKLDGVRRMWDESGELEIEEHYRNGKDHGRRWYKDHKGDVWFWKGKCVGGGDHGKAEFQRKEATK